MKNMIRVATIGLAFAINNARSDDFDSPNLTSVSREELIEYLDHSVFAVREKAARLLFDHAKRDIEQAIQRDMYPDISPYISDSSVHSLEQQLQLQAIAGRLVDMERDARWRRWEKSYIPHATINPDQQVVIKDFILEILEETGNTVPVNLSTEYAGLRVTRRPYIGMSLWEIICAIRDMEQNNRYLYFDTIHGVRDVKHDGFSYTFSDILISDGSLFGKLRKRENSRYKILILEVEPKFELLQWRIENACVTIYPEKTTQSLTGFRGIGTKTSGWPSFHLPEAKNHEDIADIIVHVDISARLRSPPFDVLSTKKVLSFKGISLLPHFP